MSSVSRRSQCTSPLSLRAVRALLVLTLVALLGCDSGGSEDFATSDPDPCQTAPCDDDADDENDGDDTSDSVAFEGFTLHPQEGAFWEYGWERTRWSGPSGGSSTGGTYLITLGPPVSLNGHTAFPVDVCGDEPPDRWTHLAFEDHRILGSEDGAPFEVLFDGQRGAWAGTGFFRDMKPDVLVTAATGRIENDFIETEAVRIGESGSSSQCEIIAGIRICGSDESESYTHFEYWQSGVGPVGLHHRSAVGFYGSQTQVGLIDHSMTAVPQTDTLAAPGVFVNALDVTLVNGPGVQFFAWADQDATFRAVTIAPPSPYEPFVVTTDTTEVPARTQVALQEAGVGYVRINGTWRMTVDLVAEDACPEPASYTVVASVEVDGGVNPEAAMRLLPLAMQQGAHPTVQILSDQD